MFAGSSRLIPAFSKNVSNRGVQGPPVISDVSFLLVHRWWRWWPSCFDSAHAPVVRAALTAEATAPAAVFAVTPINTTVPSATLTCALAPAPTLTFPPAPPPTMAWRGGDSLAHSPPFGTSGSPRASFAPATVTSTLSPTPPRAFPKRCATASHSPLVLAPSASWVNLQHPCPTL